MAEKSKKTQEEKEVPFDELVKALLAVPPKKKKKAKQAKKK